MTARPIGSTAASRVADEFVQIDGFTGLPVNSARTTTDLSSTITSGGTAQTLAAATTFRSVLFIANPDATNDLWIAFNGNTALANGKGSVRVASNGGYLQFNGDAPASIISVVGAVTGQKFTAWQG